MNERRTFSRPGNPSELFNEIEVNARREHS